MKDAYLYATMIERVNTVITALAFLGDMFKVSLSHAY